MQVRLPCHKNLNFVVSSSVLQEWVKKLHVIINVFISISFGSDFAEYVSILVNIVTFSLAGISSYLIGLYKNHMLVSQNDFAVLSPLSDACQLRLNMLDEGGVLTN